MSLKRIPATLVILAAITLLSACDQAGESTPTPVVISGSPPPLEATVEPTEILVVVVTPTQAGATEEAEAAPVETEGAEGTEAAATEEGTTPPTEATAETTAESETPPAEGTAEEAGAAEAEATTAQTDKPSETATPQAEETEEAEAAPSPEAAAAQLSSEELIDMGEGLYLLNCAACHQANGQGIEGVYPPLAGNEFILTEDPTPALEVIITGRAGMPHFGEYISDEEIAAILSYARNAWGNNASAVNVEQVSQVHENLFADVEAVEH